MRIFISAGEASGDLYASRLVEVLKARHPDAEFFGCAGPRMQAAGVRPIVDQRSLAVVGIVEVIPHIPRILGEFNKLVRACAAEPPDVAILTDSPSFHLPLARKLKRQGVPMVYLVAPQAWAWKQGRVKTMRATLESSSLYLPLRGRVFSEARRSGRLYRASAVAAGEAQTDPRRVLFETGRPAKSHELWRYFRAAGTASWRGTCPYCSKPSS